MTRMRESSGKNVAGEDGEEKEVRWKIEGDCYITFSA